MNHWFCECCIDSYCHCQGVDLVPGPRQAYPVCACCQERQCKCGGEFVHQ